MNKFERIVFKHMKKIIILFFILLSPCSIFAQYSEEMVAKATSGDADAQFSLGECFYDGDGCDRDSESKSGSVNNLMKA